MSSTLKKSSLLWAQFQTQHHPIISEFNNHLQGLSISTTAIRERSNTARHFVLWLEANELDIDVVNADIVNQFLAHDCKCPKPYGYNKRAAERRRLLLAAFVGFLADTRHAPVLAQIKTGIQVLDRFERLLLAQGYAPSTIVRYRSTCRHFLVWLYRCGIPITAVDENALQGFVNHDCGCSQSVYF